MKVLHLATSAPGGAGIAARRINQSLRYLGIDSTLLFGGVMPDFLNVGEIHDNRKLIEVGKSKITTLFQSYIVQKQAHPFTPFSISSINLNKIDFSDFDIFHIHAMYNYISFSLLEEISKFRKPIVFSLHDQRILSAGCHNALDCSEYLRNCGNCPQTYQVFRHAVQRSFIKEKETIKKLQATFVSPSQWLLDQAGISTKLCKEKLIKINNPIPEVFGSIEKIHAKNQLGYSENDLVIAFMAANLDSSFKGLSHFLDAMNELPSAIFGKTTKVLLIGKAKNKNFSINKDLTLRSSNSEQDLAKFLTSADILVVPSVGDNSPSVISEAQMCGTLVIGSNVGGIPEMLGYKTELIFESANHKSIINTLLRLDFNYNSNDIKRQAQLRYGFKVVGNQFLETYDKLLIEWNC